MLSLTSWKMFMTLFQLFQLPGSIVVAELMTLVRLFFALSKAVSRSLNTCADNRISATSTEAPARFCHEPSACLVICPIAVLLTGYLIFSIWAESSYTMDISLPKNAFLIFCSTFSKSIPCPCSRLQILTRAWKSASDSMNFPSASSFLLGIFLPPTISHESSIGLPFASTVEQINSSMLAMSFLKFWI